MIKDIQKLDFEKLEDILTSTGFQATNVGRGIKVLKEMKKNKATIFLTFTSNLVASGLRGIITQLCKEKLIDCIITAGGSLDHDLIKSEKDYELGDFSMDDQELHRAEKNRIGNILVKNECYIYLEKFMTDVFTELCTEAEKQNNPCLFAPSEIAAKIGQKTKPDSFLYHCYKNKIPVFCPGITDSAIGLQAYFFKQRKKDFGIDVTKDMSKLASVALDSEKTGGLILGGGISKHHAIGVNLLRGGFDYAVYVTTASPSDGSLSGARTNEGISWGKINEQAKHVTIDADATIVLPLLFTAFK